MNLSRFILVLLLSFFVSALISSCSSSSSAGMPNLQSRYAPKPVKPVAGRDYRLVHISYNTISQQKKYIPSKKKKYSNRKLFAKSRGRASGVGGYKYIVGPRDILSITVWDHPELTIPAGEFRSAKAAGNTVANDGLFFFPYAGRVQAKGRTTEQIRRDLEQKLSKFITKPQVGVSVASYRSQSVYITGAVKKPTVFSITDIPLTVRDIIGKAGGLTDKSLGFALLTHHKKKITISLDDLFNKGDASQNYVLRGGDSLHIHEDDKNPKELDEKYDDKVFVMGEIKKSGSFPMLDGVGLSLAKALSDAGGINEKSANPSGIFVIRNEDNKSIPTVYQLALTSVHSIALAQRFNLYPDDVVYVTASPLTKWQRIISQILPSLSIVSTTKVLTN